MAKGSTVGEMDAVMTVSINSTRNMALALTLGLMAAGTSVSG